MNTTKKLILATSIPITLMTAITAVSVQEKLQPISVLRVLDGDTVEIDAKWLPPGLGDKLKIRFYGLDTPEGYPRAKCTGEYIKSTQAKNLIEEKIKAAKEVLVLYDGWDKYGRPLGTVFADRVNLNDLLVEQKLATKYYGSGPKTDWCKTEADNAEGDL